MLLLEDLLSLTELGVLYDLRNSYLTYAFFIIGVNKEIKLFFRFNAFFFNNYLCKLQLSLIFS